MDAKVSGREVPSATRVIAVTSSGIPREHLREEEIPKKKNARKALSCFEEIEIGCSV